MKFAPGPQSKQQLGRPMRGGRSSRLKVRAFACEVLEDRRLLSVSADPGTQLLAPFGMLPPPVEPSLSAIAAPWAHTTVKVFQPGGATPLGGTSSPGGLIPTQIRHAYGIDQVLLNGTIQGDGTGQTIAIVDAYHTPTMAADLAAFDTYFGIPAPPSFTQVAQDGSTNYPSTDPAGAGTNNWELETALDVEWAHALAPGAKILLVEANSNSFTDLVSNAVNYARGVSGVVAVSMSWGGSEFSTETSLDSSFTTPGGHAGVVFLAATGDTGSPGIYPAYSPNVLAVGGTTLSLDGSNNISSESGWSGSGGGISQFENQPSYQTGVVTQSSTKRTIPDVAFDADPSTGVPVYDSYNNGNVTPWIRVGGTSFGSPSWAALVAIAEQGRALAGQPVLDSPGFLSKLYTAPAGDFNDVVGGSNGSFSAVAGYDLVTGRGTPKANLLVPDIVGKASISGTVFNDTNGSGTLDGGEAGLSGWTVYQDLNNNSTFDPSSVNSVNSTDVSKAIPTHSTITSNDVVSGLVGNLVDVNVTLNITFSRDSNLVLTLISPAGTRITLANKVGGTGANFTNTVFDDSAAVAITSGTAPFTGSFRPASPLSALIGTAPNGTWKLEVANSSNTRSGTVTSWSLQMTTGEPSTTSDGSGKYVFPGLAAGSYRIGEVLQALYTQTSPVGGFYTISLAAAANVTGENFGNRLPPSAIPTGVTLLATSDTGISSSDGITKLNNSSPATALQFQVSGTVAGATVTVLADGVPIGSAAAAGSTTSVTTNGSTLLANGNRAMTAQQTEPGKSPSPSSPPLTITIDATPPTPSIASVTPNPRITPVSQMTITFSEPVSGLDLTDLQLTHDGGVNLLSGAQTVTSLDGVSWTLADLTTLTGTSGIYQLSLAPTGSPMVDIAGNADTASATTTFSIDSRPVLDLDGTLSGGTGFASTWIGGAGPVYITAPSDATVTDADNTTLASITATEALWHTGDVLSATSSGNVTFSYNGAGVLTLSPITGTSAPIGDFQDVLRTIKYDNTSTNDGPQVLSQTVAFVANDDIAPGVAATATITINAPPIVDLDGTLSGATGFTSATWTNAGPVSITATGDASVLDGESATLNSLTVAVSSAVNGDKLSFNGSTTLGVSGANTATLTFTGPATLATFEAVLRNITYDNSNPGGPGTGPATVTFTANDGTNANSPLATATVPISVVVGFSSTVAARQLFYNQSIFDGNNAAADTSDDLAIAPDKSALQVSPSVTVTASDANVSSFSRGINGIMVDLSGTHGTLTATSLESSDFIFKTGNTNTPSTWTVFTGTTTLTTRATAGTAGSDRVELIWASSTFKNTWLEVVVKGNDALGGFDANTGLAASDVFFFGSKIADVGTSGTGAFTTNTSGDGAVLLANLLGSGATITNARDFNRDGKVNTSGDGAVLLANLGNIIRLTLPAATLPAPLPGAGSAASTTTTTTTTTTDAGISSALAATPSSVTPTVHVDPGLAFGLTANSAWTHGLESANADWPGQIDEPLLELLAIGRWHLGSRRR